LSAPRRNLELLHENEQPKAAELRSALGIADERLVARSYADLLERRRSGTTRLRV
jgi:hypothetical protein